MTDTLLRVLYRNGKPDEIRFGMPTVSRAYMDGSTAVVQYDHAGTTDFISEVENLDFVQAVTQR